MTADTHQAGRSWLRWALVVLVLAVITAAAWVAVATWTWGSALADDERLLPGTTIAGTEVGDATVIEARAAVQAVVDEALDRVVTVEHGERSWQITPREAGASADVDGVVDDALEAATSTGFIEHVGFRWLGRAAEIDLEVTIELDEGEIAAFVDTLATEIDHDPADAVIEADGDDLRVTDHATGEQLDADATRTALAAALDAGGDTLTLDVETLTPAITTDLATAVLPGIASAIDEALDRQITLAYDGRSWSTSPRELGASADAGPAIEQALADAVASDTSDDDGDAEAVDAPVPLNVPDEELQALVASVAAEVDIAAVDAELSASASGISISPERTGLAVDRGDAVAQLEDAVANGTSELTVPTVTVQPNRTASSFGHVLVLRQSDRELDLYRNGERSHTWPVAVGTGGSPTPTGTFTVGAKRFEPTWVNPSPDGWGKDMPDRIGPGPDNPLGVRALNWNRPGGGDTLIRFHGTPNEASIGQAASNGCVRMYNADVVQLYDLVPSGTTIISLG